MSVIFVKLKKWRNFYLTQKLTLAYIYSHLQLYTTHMNMFNLGSIVIYKFRIKSTKIRSDIWHNLFLCENFLIGANCPLDFGISNLRYSKLHNNL